MLHRVGCLLPHPRTSRFADPSPLDLSKSFERPAANQWICDARTDVGIRLQINRMKLDKHTWRLFLSPSVRIARSKLFLFISCFLIFPMLQLAARLVYIYTASTQNRLKTILVLHALILPIGKLKPTIAFPRLFLLGHV
jgi:hypothetical protein